MPSSVSIGKGDSAIVTLSAIVFVKSRALSAIVTLSAIVFVKGRALSAIVSTGDYRHWRLSHRSGKRNTHFIEVGVPELINCYRCFNPFLLLISPCNRSGVSGMRNSSRFEFCFFLTMSSLLASFLPLSCSLVSACP